MSTATLVAPPMHAAPAFAPQLPEPFLNTVCHQLHSRKYDSSICNGHCKLDLPHLLDGKCECDTCGEKF